MRSTSSHGKTIYTSNTTQQHALTLRRPLLPPPLPLFVPSPFFLSFLGQSSDHMLLPQVRPRGSDVHHVLHGGQEAADGSRAARAPQQGLVVA